MSDPVRRLVGALSKNGRDHPFDNLRLPTPDTQDMKPRARDRKFIETIIQAAPAIRAQAEAIAGEIEGLAAKTDLAEHCLYMVCRHDAALVEILEREASLHERALNILLANPSHFDRARNVAMAHYWRDSKSNCAFSLEGGHGALSQWDDIRVAMQAAANEIGLGRRASIDVFEYNDATNEPVYHLAIYLESAAAMMREFKGNDDWPEVVIHREAKEIAIDFSPSRNELQVAGKGVGGAKMLQKLARAFAKAGFPNSEVVEIKRRHWNLTQFVGGHPSWFAPPKAYASAVVTELRTFSDCGSKGKLQVMSSDGAPVYDRLRQLGLSFDVLAHETVAAVTISLNRHAELTESKPRTVRLTLTWPNARCIEGDSTSDRTEIEIWLKLPEFYETT